MRYASHSLSASAICCDGWLARDYLTRFIVEVVDGLDLHA